MPFKPMEPPNINKLDITFGSRLLPFNMPLNLNLRILSRKCKLLNAGILSIFFRLFPDISNFRFSNIIFMEIAPWIPPGTTFNCRFRTRFSNCEDCYNNDNFSKDDHLDYEFSGGEAFKLINFQFTVID